MARLLSKENWLLALLVFFPIALLLEYAVHASALAIFLASAAAIIPLAALMGRATEQRRSKSSPSAARCGSCRSSRKDGESHWMEGVQLLAVYVILGMAFYWLPMPS